MKDFFTPFSTMEVLVFLVKGLGMTLLIAIVSILLSFVFGSLLGIARFSSKGLLGKLAAIYIDSVRNIPLLLFILSFRLMFPSYILGMKIPNKPLVSSIIAMTVFTSAMVAEILRGGLNSIPKGQWEAATSQGFGFWHTMIHIILPQAIKKILVPLMGQFVTCLKDTSFCQVVGISELMMNATIIMGKFKYSSQVIVLYIIVALMYYFVNVSVLAVSRRIKF
ncbi:amino acid ABC transporter permease [uncultured Sphaerochaeta sp.]|uniref:amino acid ABC transporter permease n=1 Tax=uncultured Sphaerochaeta sp. TaxID=886478 RepID=UPI002A0A79E6|nr:amino acid ABC transporter permease [uncultured Sphaerochaeta sp.]